MKKFPKSKLKKHIIQRRLERAIVGTVDYKKGTLLGYPGSTPLKESIQAINKFLLLNPNNIGTHTRGNSEVGFRGIQELEAEAIAMIGGLFGGDEKNQVDGYISSGGTEGNVMGLWILRNLCLTKRTAEPCVLLPSSAHYSAAKALNMLSLPKVYEVGLDDGYKIRTDDLGAKIRRLAGNGEKNFIVFCSLGYTMTGSYDSIDEINQVSLELEKEFGVKIYIHIDAAHGGFIYPFLGGKTYGFNQAKVMTISLDAHKTGLVPYSCGIFLCRKNLQEHTQTRADYIKSHFDDTLIGSRSGAIAAGLWAAINSLGKSGYKKIYLRCLAQKKSFLDKLEKTKIRNWYFTDPIGNIATVQFLDFPGYRLPKSIEEKYALNLAELSDGKNKRKVYKIVFMPHVSRRITDAFVSDLLKLKGKFEG